MVCAIVVEIGIHLTIPVLNQIFGYTATVQAMQCEGPTILSDEILDAVEEQEAALKEIQLSANAIVGSDWQSSDVDLVGFW